MMDRGDFEYFAFEEFFGGDLDDYGKGFNYKDKAN